MILHVSLDGAPISVSACMIVATVANDTAASIANNANVAFPANDKAVAVATLSNADVAVDASANNAAANDAIPVNGEAADAAIMSSTDLAADAVASLANDAAMNDADAVDVAFSAADAPSFADNMLRTNHAASFFCSSPLQTEVSFQRND